MSRSGYSDECDDLALYRGIVERVLRSKRGQAFLNELAVQMDAMPEKVLIAHELINQSGGCCTMGVVCKARKLDVSKIEYEDPESVARALGINHMMAAEIAYMNDEYLLHDEAPAARWERMRKWVSENLVAQTPNADFRNAVTGAPDCKQDAQ
jgi:hypothetical protein